MYRFALSGGSRRRPGCSGSICAAGAPKGRTASRSAAPELWGSPSRSRGTVVSREPVKISTENGTIEAEGVQVSDSGRTLSFQGRVRTQFSRAAIEPGGAPRNDGPARMTQADAPQR